MRHRRVLAAVLAGLVGPLTATAPPDLADFATLGGLLLEGRLGEVYAPAWNQAGPLQLLISRLLLVGGADGVPAPLVTALVDGAAVVAAMALCGRLTADRGAVLARRELVAGLLTLLWLAAPLPWNGHPAELAVPACWAYAIVLQRRNRCAAAAAVLAIAVAIAPWGVLGLPCLLAAGRPRAALAAATAGSVLGAAVYLPFVLTGQFAMFGHRWGVAAGSLPHLLGLHEITWWFRLLQAVLVAGGCALVAWHGRGERPAIATAPLAAALLRTATDPLALSYYWFPVAVASLLLIALVPATADRRTRALAVLLGYLALLAEASGWTLPGAVACLAVLAAAQRTRGPSSLRERTVPTSLRAEATRLRAGTAG